MPGQPSRAGWGFGSTCLGVAALWIAAWSVVITLPLSSTTRWYLVEVVVGIGCLLRLRPRSGVRLAGLGLARRDLGRGLAQGLPAAFVWAAVLVAAGAARRSDWVMPAVTPALLVTTVLGPALEELIFRGYLFRAAEGSGRSFLRTDLVTSLLFVTVHAVGWAFLGTARVHLLSGYPLSLLAVSLLAGLVRRRSGSLVAGLLVHVAHNVVSVAAR